MKKLSDYSLSQKILLIPLIAVFGFGAYLIYSFMALSAGSTIVKNIRDADLPKLEVADKNISKIDAILVALNTAAATGENEYLNVAKDKANEILSSYDTLENLDGTHKSEIEKLKSAFNIYFALANDIAQQMAEKKTPPSYSQISKMQAARDVYLSGSLAYRDAAEKYFHASVAESMEKAERAKTLGTFLGIVMLLTIILLTWLVLGDIAHKKKIEDSLRVTASVFDNTLEAIIITDANNSIIDINSAFTYITGYSREEVIGHNPKLLSSGRQDKAFYKAMWQSLEQQGSWRGEIWNRRKSGEIYPEVLSISALSDHLGRVLRYVAVFSDISHFKEHEAELSRVAYYDVLTGIPNRLLLADRMKQAIFQASREQNMMAVCYLDLDGFKPINDTFGHETGDRVLIEIAKRIGDTIRGGDTVSRLGGDEFVVLLLGLDKGEECVSTLERLLVAIAQPINFQNSSCTVSASIGVSIYPLDDVDPDTLMRHADQAMYLSKQSGKNRFHIYDPAIDRRARDQNEF